MNYIKFDTIDSTNDFLKNYAKLKSLPDFFYVYANHQTKGKGQRINVWKSEYNKNLLVSFFVKPNIIASEQYLLNQIVTVSIIKLLKKHDITDLKIKFPNDILSGYNKIAGVLIENVIYKKIIKESIIGIGLNVNQTCFDSLPFATSMKILAQKEFNRDELLIELSDILKNNFKLPIEKCIEEFNKYLIKQEVYPIKKI